MTSNLGSEYLSGKVDETVKMNVMNVVRRSFKPELLNRITDIVIFHPLDKVHLAKIVVLLLQQTGQRLAPPANPWICHPFQMHLPLSAEFKLS